VSRHSLAPQPKAIPHSRPGSVCVSGRHYRRDKTTVFFCCASTCSWINHARQILIYARARTHTHTRARAHTHSHTQSCTPLSCNHTHTSLSNTHTPHSLNHTHTSLSITPLTRSHTPLLQTLLGVGAPGPQDMTGLQYSLSRGRIAPV